MSTTTRGISKSDLLAKIEHGYVASRAVLDALPAERWTETLPAGWTLKEMVGHLAYWEDTVPPFVARVCERETFGVKERPFEPLEGSQIARNPSSYAAVE